VVTAAEQLQRDRSIPIAVTNYIYPNPVVMWQQVPKHCYTKWQPRTPRGL